MRLGAGDPGKHRDAFAEVVAVIPPEQNKLQIKAAKRWTTPPGVSVSGMGPFYLNVEEKIAEQHRNKPFDAFILEINNTGTHVYEELRFRQNMPVVPVTTTRQLVNLDKKFDPERMDKNETVGVAIMWNENGTMEFPRTLTPELVELQRQLSIFAEHKTEEAGNVSYRAPGSEHDDLVMALLLIVHHAKRILRSWDLIGIGPREIEQIEKENLPKSSIRIVDG